MCSWERFDPDLAGETVTLWWGLFDQELFVEHDGKRFGPYRPSRGAIPLYRYRKHQKSRAEERLDRIVQLADQLGLPRAALDGGDRPLPSLPPGAGLPVRYTPFPEPAADSAFATPLAARFAIADQLGLPLRRLDEADRAFITALLAETLDRAIIADRVREHFQARTRKR
jgi:hypothetical protein